MGTGKTTRGWREEWRQETCTTVWIQQFCNSNVRWWSLGLEGVEGRKGGVTGFLLWHTLLCPFPACLLRKCPAPLPFSWKILLSQARRSDKPDVSFLVISHFLPDSFRWLWRKKSTKKPLWTVLLNSGHLWRKAFPTVTAEIWDTRLSKIMVPKYEQSDFI